MIKLLFFADRLRRGGIQTLLLNYTIELLKTKNIKIDLLLFDDGIEYELEQTFRDIGCNIYKVAWPQIRQIHLCLRELDSFFKNHHDYNIIHAHSSSKALLPLFYAKKYNIQVRIAHSHSTKFQTSNPIKIFIGDIMKLPLRRIANHYFACSTLAAQWLFGKNLNTKKVYILNNALNLETFLYNPTTRKELRDKLGLNENSIVIGNVSRFTAVKNHHFIIDIFQEFHKLNENSYLVLVGIGETQQEIIKYVNELGLQKNVIFAGFRNDTFRFYQAFDLFLMPSLYEGLPFVGIEAQTAGLPCLFSDTITKEVKILPNVEFLSLNDSPSLWSEKISQLIDQNSRKNLLSEISNAGYNIKIEAQKLYQYYLISSK